MEPKNRIRIIIAELEMTTNDFADRIGVSPETVSRWSSNKQQPSLKHMYKISEVFEIDVCRILVRPKYKKD